MTKAKPPFLAFAADAQDLETLKAFAVSQGWGEDSVYPGTIAEATEYLKTNPAPTLLLVELTSEEAAPAQLDALADVCDPNTKVMTIGAIDEYSFYCWLTEIGIFSYLLKPLSQQSLEGAHHKITLPAGAASQEKPLGKVIAVIGARGGAGATTVAVNLAGIAAELTHKKIALMDADPQTGSVALALDIEPSRGLRDVLEKPDRIDSLFIERVMSKPHKHLSVLSAEEALGEQVHVHEQAAELLLKEMRDKFDVIIMDIPRQLDQFGRGCLKHAEHVVIVSEMTLGGLRDAMRLQDLIRDTLKIKSIFFVANRIGLAEAEEMQTGDFEKSIGGKLAQKITFAPNIFMQVGTDIPALKSKSHDAVRPLYDLAAQLMPEAKIKTQAKKKASFDLMAMFNKKKG